MKYILKIFLFVSLITIIATPAVMAIEEIPKVNELDETNQEFILQENYFIGKIINILDENFQQYDEFEDPLPIYQSLEMEVLTGQNKGELINYFHEHATSSTIFEKYKIGEKLILMENNYSDAEYILVSKDRTSSIILTIGFLLFLILVLLQKKSWRGLLSLLCVFAVLLGFTIPQALENMNILIVSLISALLILSVTSVINFGFSEKTVFSFLSSVVTIVFSIMFFSVVILLFKPLGLVSNISTSLYFSLIQELKLTNIYLLILTLAPIGFLIDNSRRIYKTLAAQYQKNSTNFWKYLKATVFNKKATEIILSQLNSLTIIFAAVFIPTYLHLFYATNITVPLWVKINIENIPDLIIMLLLFIITIIINIPILSAFYYFIKKANSNKSQ